MFPLIKYIIVFPIIINSPPLRINNIKPKVTIYYYQLRIAIYHCIVSNLIQSHSLFSIFQFSALFINHIQVISRHNTWCRVLCEFEPGHEKRRFVINFLYLHWISVVFEKIVQASWKSEEVSYCCQSQFFIE